jgi:hypothetical protein
MCRPACGGFECLPRIIPKHDQIERLEPTRNSVELADFRFAADSDATACPNFAAENLRQKVVRVLAGAHHLDMQAMPSSAAGEI